MTDEQKLAEIKASWSETDSQLYKTHENKLQSLKAAETRVIPKESKQVKE